MEKLAKVLLVDDDSTTLFLHNTLISKLGVAEHLLEARNGLEAFQVLEQACHEPENPNDPILILLDVNMPLMNGFDFLKAFQQHPLTQQENLVIIVLTTSEFGLDIQRIKELSVAADILTKPLTRGKVEFILQRYFQRSLLVA
jgi:CheY-like chemotaxis protein